MLLLTLLLLLCFRTDILSSQHSGLAGEIALVNIFQDFLTLEYEQEKLSRYSVEWQPDDRHLARVGNPRISRHPYQSPQQELWQAGSVEWFVIIRNAPPVRAIDPQKPSGGDATAIAS